MAARRVGSLSPSGCPSPAGGPAFLHRQHCVDSVGGLFVYVLHMKWGGNSVGAGEEDLFILEADLIIFKIWKLNNFLREEKHFLRAQHCFLENTTGKYILPPPPFTKYIFLSNKTHTKVFLGQKNKMFSELMKMRACSFTCLFVNQFPCIVRSPPDSPTCK